MNAEPSKHKNIDMEKSVVERQPEVNILAFFSVVASSQISPHSEPGRQIQHAKPVSAHKYTHKNRNSKNFLLVRGSGHFTDELRNSDECVRGKWGFHGQKSFVG